jgi:hypothetical protein
MKHYLMPERFASAPLAAGVPNGYGPQEAACERGHNESDDLPQPQMRHLA